MRGTALILCYVGWLALCLAMPKYFRQVIRHHAALPIRHVLRGIGWAGLAGSLAVSVWIDGWSFGPLSWVGHLGVTGLVLVFMLPYLPRVALAVGIFGIASTVAWWLN